MVALTQSTHHSNSRPHQSSFPRTHPRNDGESRRQQQQQANNSATWWPSSQWLDGIINPPETHNPKQRRQPNYPRTIEFTPSYDEEDKPFDEADYSLLGLNRQQGNNRNQMMKVQSESFGFDLDPLPSTAADDIVFDRLYHGDDDCEEDQTQTTFCGLNPYHQNVASDELDNAILASRQQQAEAVQHPERNGDIFRSSSASMPARQQQQPLKSVLKSGDVANIISPATVMERRRSHKQPTTGITRSRSHSRHRSSGGSSRSSSRDVQRTSSRASRSVSRGPNKATIMTDNYHSSVFRGAALIREQLLRSMASADHAMDEANKEFMMSNPATPNNDDDHGNEWGREQKLARLVKEARHNSKKNVGGDEDIDFDYSDKYRRPEQGAIPITPLSRGVGGVGAGNNVRFAANKVNADESQRLDDLARIFMSSSSTSTSKSGDKKSNTADKSSDKSHMDNSRVEVATVAKTEDGWQQHEVQMIMGTRVVSPSESKGHSVNNCTPPSAGVSNQHADRYLQKEQTPQTSNILNAVRVVPTTRNLDKDQPLQEDVKEDEALAHARRAGPLWRALVGNHVRFPSNWETILGSTTPSPIARYQKWSKWYYIARHRVKGDKCLNSREFGVRSRRSGGRLLMRLVVKEIHSQNVCREIVVGCFHPNSKGVRRGDPSVENEDIREVYMAARWTMCETDEEPRLDLRKGQHDYEGVVDNFLMQRRSWLDYSTMGSALGHRKAVNNENVKAIFGDQPPSLTTELHEDEFAEILKNNGVENVAVLPALVLLKLFLFD